ncbi:MAG TPA: hypothetical protein VHG71_11680 [Verrucomicrobiae bacterium]|nr:hypothetical protein [Verrucomicrobiae bacterium]
MYKTSVPNKRHPDQTLIAVAMDKQLRKAIKVGREQIRRDQSTFIRLAIVEKLNRIGIPVDEKLALAPDREKTTSVSLNDKSNSKIAAAVKHYAENVGKPISYPKPKRAKKSPARPDRAASTLPLT